MPTFSHEISFNIFVKKFLSAVW